MDGVEPYCGLGVDPVEDLSQVEEVGGHPFGFGLHRWSKSLDLLHGLELLGVGQHAAACDHQPRRVEKVSQGLDLALDGLVS